MMVTEFPVVIPQSPQEERFNTLTHGLGTALSLVGLGAMLVLAAPHGPVAVFVCLLYGLCLVTMFATSTVYHALSQGPRKCLARKLDHCCILVLIAGSYAPFMMLALGGVKGWGVLLAVWALAIAGIRHKFVSKNPFGAASVILCLLMGWLILAVWKPLVMCLAPSALWWLVAGGIGYTAGVPFYAWRGLPYGHGIWHLFVLAGAGCHYVSVLQVL